MDYSDFDPTAPKVKRERYLLGYLGSVETLAHKGTGVVCQAVRRILRNSLQDPPVSQSCILEVSDQGLRMVDRSKPRVSNSLRLKFLHVCNVWFMQAIYSSTKTIYVVKFRYAIEYTIPLKKIYIYKQIILNKLFIYFLKLYLHASNITCVI